MVTSRFLVDRRSGTDHRSAARRRSITLITVERRQLVDRRRGAERRSTLDRRGRPRRGTAGPETPSEHLRNALQLLTQLRASDGAVERGALHTRIGQRLTKALALLEGREATGP